MLPHIFFYNRWICIGIAITAQMPAGIIGSNIRTQQTGTLTIPLIGLSFGNMKVCMKGGFKGIHRHTAGAVGTVLGKLRSFRTGANS